MNLEFDKITIQENMPFIFVKKIEKINFNLLKISVQVYTLTFIKIFRSLNKASGNLIYKFQSIFHRTAI